MLYIPCGFRAKKKGVYLNAAHSSETPSLENTQCTQLCRLTLATQTVLSRPLCQQGSRVPVVVFDRVLHPTRQGGMVGNFFGGSLVHRHLGPPSSSGRGRRGAGRGCLCAWCRRDSGQLLHKAPVSLAQELLARLQQSISSLKCADCKRINERNSQEVVEFCRNHQQGPQ